MNDPAKSGEIFIVDNSDSDWKGLRYMKSETSLMLVPIFPG